MERDFMGLTVKQETSNEPIDAAPVRSSAMQWSFSNKSSSAHQLLSFPEDQKPKTGFDSLAPAGLVTATASESQKNILEKQGGVCYTMTTYPTAIHRPVGTPSAVHQPVVAAPAVPSSSLVVGSTDLRNSSKISGAPAQMTIFYNGSVCVFDNISPEKAQAIMLLAGNGPPSNPSAPPPAALVQATMPRPSVLEGFVVSQPYGTTPHRLSPVPVTVPISVPQPAGRSADNSAVKPAGAVVTTSLNTAEPQKVVNSSLGVGAVSANFLSSDTVPQFRRKSLARFLEKRKERVISASPYEEKRSPECSNKPVPATN